MIEIGGSDHRALGTGDPIALTEVEPDAIAWLFYTSGTTGRPKGAMLSHRNLLAMTLSYFADVDRIGPADAILHAAPMSHGSGLYILPHAAQGACQIVPASGGFDPAEVFELLDRHQGVTLFGAPTMVKRLAEHPLAGRTDHPGLKTIVYGGGPMYLADLERAQAVFGDRLAQIYGQGESPMCITALSKARHAELAQAGDRARLASVGTAQLVVEVRVADEGDRPLPAGEPGEVLVRGESVMRGYWRDPEATAAALRGGWLHTGDLGVMDADGFLWLRDRAKDLIISGGANIYPREVEEVLLEHPRGPRGLGGRQARPRVGRDRGRLRRHGGRRAGRGRRARRPLPGPDRPLQAAAGLPLRRRSAQERLRQGAQDRAQERAPAAALSATVSSGRRACRLRRARSGSTRSSGRAAATGTPRAACPRRRRPSASARR